MPFSGTTKAGWKDHGLKSSNNDVNNFLTKGIQALQQRQKKYVDYKKDYIEK